MKIQMSIEDKRKLLDSAKGQFFSVSFIKKDKTIREMTAKRWEEKALTYGSGDVRANPCAHKPEIYTLSENGQFKNLDLNGLIKCTVSGKTYEFTT